MYRFKKDTYETSQHIKMYGPYLDVISTNYKLKKKNYKSFGGNDGIYDVKKLLIFRYENGVIVVVNIFF